MPYLTDKRKKELANPKRRLITPGDLTYAMTLAVLNRGATLLAPNLDAAIKRYMPRHPRYEDYAIVLGCLTSTFMEYERRVGAPDQFCDDFADYMSKFYKDRVAPYEDAKIESNGDVYVLCPNPKCDKGEVPGGSKGWLLCPDCKGTGWAL